VGARFRLRRREYLVVAAIWLLGLGALASVLVLQGRLDQRRKAELAVASLRTQVGSLPRMALGLNGSPTRAEVQAQLDAAERQIEATASSLDGLAGNSSDSQRIMEEAHALFPLLERANAVARTGRLKAATMTLGLALLPGQPGAQMNATFDEIGGKYGRQAASARRLSDLGSASAILLLLVAISVALWRASRLARERHHLLEQSRRDALTDELTGLSNRRKLFADLDARLGLTGAEGQSVLGIFDLDGFKAYNDRFGHPAGDALLSRMGSALRTAVNGAGTAYRLGGDEFCVIAHGPAAGMVLERARVALAERAGDLSISCSLGATGITADGSTTDDVLRRADERLYDAKRSAHAALAVHVEAGGEPVFV
jgi:diguanylate cyclase (GGDEF)-like protein